MADTDIRECKICGYETDCINSVCLECSLVDADVKQLQKDVADLKDKQESIGSLLISVSELVQKYI